MVPIATYNVLTEFKFDIAHAVASSKTLQTEVGKISSAAENTLMSLQNMAKSALASFGLFGGAAGFLWNAINASEKFEQSQRKLANVFLNNQSAFGAAGITYEKSMLHSEKIMDSIRKKALEFGLDPTEMFNQMTAISPMLLSAKLDGPDLANSIDITRGLMKSSDTLGIDRSNIGGQLINLVGGHADLNNTLFQRLMSETQPFKDAKINSSKGYNALPEAKRIDLLRRSLLQFASVTEINEGNMKSLNNQMTIFKSLTYGMYSIFKGIGKAFAEPLKKIMFAVNEFLATHGLATAEAVSKFFHTMLENPKKLLITLMQLANLKTDIGWAAKIAEFMASLHMIGWVASKVGFKIHWLASIFPFLKKGMEFIGTGIIKVLPHLATFGTFLLRHVAWPLALWTTILQGVSRGIAQAKIIDLEFFAKNAAKFVTFMGEMKTAFSKIFLPITLFVNAIGDVVGWILSAGYFSQYATDKLHLVSDAFQVLGDSVVNIMATLSGLLAMASSFVPSLMAHGPGPEMAERMLGAFDDEYKRMWATYGHQTIAGTDTSNPVSTQNVNINKVEINNQFKEQMEPDRIAFTLQEQLMKAAINPGGSGGRSMRGALVGN